MIAAHPLSGWGYGSFEYAFQHFRIELVPPTRVLEIARHPHNELLYWWVEGGLVALLGISLLILGGGRLLLQVFRHDRRAFSTGAANAGETSALCLALLPMLIHTQLEYPFYLSAMHWMVFLLLLAMADRLSCRKVGVIILPARGTVAAALWHWRAVHGDGCDYGGDFPRRSFADAGRAQWAARYSDPGRDVADCAMGAAGSSQF